MQTTNETFRSLLQNIVCDRYFDKSAALRAIDEAFDVGNITQLECRKLEAHIG